MANPTTLERPPERTPKHNQKRRAPKRSLPTWVAPSAFLAVPMIYLGILVLWPLIAEIWLSFTNAKLANPNGGSFVGLDNYVTLITGKGLTQVLLNTLAYTLGTASLALAAGVFAANLVNVKFFGNKTVSAILTAPWAVPGVAAALVWLWMFTGKSGILNRLLTWLSLDPVPWLTASPMAMISVIIVTSWQFAPFVMLVTLAALQSVPDEVAEAARVDGATGISVFRYVTLPHISPTIRLMAILLVIWCLRRWDIITVLTGGGPVNSTSTIVVALQRQAFEFQQVGVGAAYALVGIVIATLFAVLYLLVERREAAKAES